MNSNRQTDEAALRLLFEKFVRTGLTGDIDGFVALLDDPYTGVGLGEQGLVTGKSQVDAIMRASYRAAEDDTIKTEVAKLMINFLHDDVAILSGAVGVTTVPKSGEPLRSDLIQTIGARRKGDRWVIGFTHASVSLLSQESLEAYPIKFMDHTLSRLKAELRPDVVLYSEIDLTNNSVIQMGGNLFKSQDSILLDTLEDVAEYGLSGRLDDAVLAEYHSFFNRLRLMGLFAEGVPEDQFRYCLNPDSHPVWIQVSITTMRHQYSGDILAVVTYTEIPDYKNELELLSHKAFHDALTGILNREGFDRKATEMLGVYSPRESTALLMIDLDDFKQVNDRLGHQIGDTMLRQVAGVLQDTFRDTGAVGRIGGDEFMVLLTGEFSLGWVEQRAMELLTAMKLHMGTTKQIPVSISIGIAYGRARATFDKLYRIADIALYTAKKAGKCRFHLINSDSNAEHTYTNSMAALLSLQTLLDYTDDRKIVQNRTPYEALIENIPGGVLLISLSDSLKLTYCNDWVEKVLGYTHGELEAIQQDDPLSLVHPDDISHVRHILERMRAGQERVDAAYRLRNKSGCYLRFNLNASMTERSNDEMIYYGINTLADGEAETRL